MKKRIIKILIILLILAGILVGISNAASSYVDWNNYFKVNVGTNGYNKIIGKDGKVYTTNIGTELYVEQYIAAGSADGEKYISILNQPNVWCVQHGVAMKWKENGIPYKVFLGRTVDDPVLAYILNQRGTENLQQYWVDAPNVALWYYLSDENNANTADSKEMLNGISCQKPATDGTDAQYNSAKNNEDRKKLVNIDEVYDEGQDIYDLAMYYEGSLNTFEKSTNWIQKYELIGNNQIKFQYWLNCDSFDVYINNTFIKTYTSSDLLHDITVNIPSGTTSNVSLKVVAKMQKYHAQYKILKTAEDQRLIQVNPWTETITHTDTITLERNKPNVSLQKYITKVNGNCVTKSGIINGTEENARKNGRTFPEETNLGVKDAISTSNTAVSNYYKRKNPVIINAGDEVTYRICLYNNSDVNATNVKFVDDCTNGNSNYNGIEIVSFICNNMDFKKFLTYNGNTISFTISSIAGKGTLIFDMTVKYKNYYDGRLNNVVWIAGTEPTNEGTYRTVDADYVVMKKVNVSLQKYITKVNGNDITTNNTRVTDRANKKWSNEDSNGRVSDKIYKNGRQYQEATEPYKKQNPVFIDVGDKVTYRIYVYNNKTEVPNVVQINDEYHNTTVELESIKINGNNSDIKDNWTETINTDNNYKSYIYYITPNAWIDNQVYFDITLKFKEEFSGLFENQVYIGNMNSQKYEHYTRNGDIQTSTYRTLDFDYVQMVEYKVSLKKIVSSVYDGSTRSSFNSRWDSWENNANKNTSKTGIAYTKYNNPVEVAKGNKVTYAIKVKNDGTTKVKNIQIKDTLPNGLTSARIEKIEGINGPLSDININRTEVTFKIPELDKNQTATIYLSTSVRESNMSLNVLRNYAEITGTMQNRNNIEVEDSTPDDNQDADYIQMKDIVISGTVWNDKALDKTQDNYNGQYDSQENKLGGIKVYLYRRGVTDAIATTTTDNNGNYSFELDYIKGPKVSSTINRWAGTYYSYYVVFEYDGITYTSTAFADVTSNNPLDSNAKEDGKKVKESRTTFNNRFSKINNTSGITYTTKNEDGYIPQSNHVYNPSTMAMQSSTNLIRLSNTPALEQQLQHVNLGLRGRDTFDLELTSDVTKVDVTVNEQTGTYDFTNKVTVRRSDLYDENSNSNYYKYGDTTVPREDAANVYNEESTYAGENQVQPIRTSDLSNSKYDSSQLLQSIKVTYKITVTNASQTSGTATKVIDYYAKDYSSPEAVLYKQDGANEVKVKDISIPSTAINSETNYNSVELDVGDDVILNQSESYYIYLTLTMDCNVLKNKFKDEETLNYPTYNMAEITEYKTQYVSGQTEYTRGLIDIDSAPGSANKEQVRTTDTVDKNTKTTEGNPTTVQYYFAGNNLDKLKYEDDTYAAPTLYFVSDNSKRTITGTVFEDETKIVGDNIRTGNGIKDPSETGIDRVNVQLLEEVSAGTSGAITYNGKHYKRRYNHFTNGNGENNYKFEGILPGNYIIHYNYGNRNETFLYPRDDINMNPGINSNSKSYNGEDFQSTNNTGTHGAAQLKVDGNDWYVQYQTDTRDNKISTATDNSNRRIVVSNNVTGFSDDKMTILNNARDGIQEKNEAAKDVALDTYMYADTPKMTLGVENKFVDGTNIRESNTFGAYNIINMNFGIAEVPVTTIDLQKTVQSFTLTDSTGKNTIASAVNNAGRWELQGDVLAPGGASSIDVSVEDEKLQGARLQVTYAITSKIYTEKNFDNKTLTVPTITGIVDYIDNNLSYNVALGENSKYWEATTYEEIESTYASMQYKNGTLPKGTVDPEGNKYTTIVKAKNNNPLLLTTAGEGTATITLEKILSSTDSTIEEIITSTVDIYAYNNTVEITGINYKNVTSTDPESDSNDSDPQRDRVRTTDRYIILPGVQHDSATAETITIHPPTGDSSISIMYYVIAVISLVVLVAGVFGIKKFVLRK